MKSPEDWPGFITLGLCERHVVYRPKHYFRDTDAGPMPRRAALVTTVPRMLSHVPREELDRQLRERVKVHVEAARERMREEGRVFLGADGVRTMPIGGRATTPESARHRKPVIWARDPERLRAAIARLRAFREAYEE